MNLPLPMRSETVGIAQAYALHDELPGIDRLQCAERLGTEAGHEHVAHDASVLRLGRAEQPASTGDSDGGSVPIRV